jgi:eukaryotic-like serine/threonine-protein kinase
MAAPDVCGLPLDEARRMLSRIGVVPGEPIPRQDSVEAKNRVINQFPDAGDQVNAASAVSLVVSSGPVILPDLAGMKAEAAATRLEELSLRAGAGYVASDRQPEGHVIETTPEA